MKECLRTPRHAVPPCLAVPLSLAALLLAACATVPAPRALAYHEARATCEFMRGGRPGSERRQASGAGAEARLAACLERRGWHADGTPTLRQLLGEPR